MTDQEDLGWGDRLVFVSASDAPPITAQGVLNIVTANVDFFRDFVELPSTSIFDDNSGFRPPVIESLNYGDDLLVTLTAEDLSLTLQVYATADGTGSTVTIAPLTMSAEDFAELIAPGEIDPDDLLGLNDVVDAFYGIGLTPFEQGGSYYQPDGRSFNDGNLFGSYDFFDLRGDYGSFDRFDRFDSFGSGGGGGGGGRFNEFYSSYDGVDYINLDIFG